MAKILVPKTRNQLSLSFEGRLDRTGLWSLPDISPELYDQAVRGVLERFGEIFKPVTFTSVAHAIKTAGARETLLIAKGGRALTMSHTIINVLDKPSRATVGLVLNLRGPSNEADRVYQAILDDLDLPAEKSENISVEHGMLVASVPVDPVTRIRVGTLETPPAHESFVLPQEAERLLPQLALLGRPYEIVAPSIA